MNPFKVYIELLKANHYIRIVTGCVLLGVGALFGTDGLTEITEARYLFDTMMWMGIVILTVYTIVATIAGIYYGLGNGYQPGDYNKWRDGGTLEEWKKKNDIGNGWFDRFLDWFEKPFEKRNK